MWESLFRAKFLLNFLIFSQKRYVFKWNGNLPQYWRKLDNLQLEIPENTILEAEFIYEMRGEVFIFLLVNWIYLKHV